MPAPDELEPSRAPLDPSACTCAGLRRAARAVTQAFDAALQPIGLTATQFAILAELSRRRVIPLGRLAEAMVTDRTTLTRTLQPLAARGLLRVGVGGDRRCRMVSITNRGRYIHAEARPLWAAVQEHLVEGLGRLRWSGLLHHLDAVVDVAHRGKKV